MVDGHSMTYNSEKELLTMPEYGRNIQLLVLHAREIEELEQKQAFIERIVDLIQQMHPQTKNVEDYRTKIWKHVFRIAEYELEGVVVPTTGEAPNKEADNVKPETIPYPKSDTRFRHYGNNVNKLIQKALEMEEGPVRTGFVNTIGSYMKLAYRTWNKEHYVSDEVIKNDLEKFSGGKLKIDNSIILDHLSGTNNKRRSNDNRGDRRDRDNYRGGRSNNNYGKGGRGGKGGKKRR